MDLDQFIGLLSALGDFGGLIDGSAYFLEVLASDEFNGSIASLS